jgi:hypothetical protein
MSLGSLGVGRVQQQFPRLGLVQLRERERDHPAGGGVEQQEQRIAPEDGGAFLIPSLLRGSC